MDLSDINKVASRKRINTDAEKLREKMSRESSKIIKLRVAQDTAYWDLKERLRGVEGEHERLQRNMLDVQMQHEALSARYQDELRLRPETLNRLAGTRDICDVLEEYAGRVRASLRRAAADRAALAQSYSGAARRVHSAAHHAALQANAAAARVAASESRVAQLAEGLGAARELLRAAAERGDRLRDQLLERERTIAELRRDAELRATEAAAEGERAAALRRELEAGAAALADARRALAAHEERAARAAEEATRSGAALQNLEETGADLKRELETVRAANEALRTEIEERDREASASAARAEAARGEAEAARAELREQREAAGAAAAAAERALAERADTVARLMRDVAGEAEARARTEAACGAADERARALAARLQAKESELAGQTSIVLEMRREKERLQDIIRGMQGTIDNIQKELTREPPGAAAAAAEARREPPEHDDNALAAPPTPKGSRGARRGDAFAPPAPPPRPRAADADELLYHFLSDSSVDADSLDPNEVNARFEALSRGGPAPLATSLQALKRPLAVSVAHARPAPPAVSVAHAGAGDVSLSQVKSELAARGRTFFRNKRLDLKSKKFK